MRGTPIELQEPIHSRNSKGKTQNIKEIKINMTPTKQNFPMIKTKTDSFKVHN